MTRLVFTAAINSLAVGVCRSYVLRVPMIREGPPFIKFYKSPMDKFLHITSSLAAFVDFHNLRYVRTILTA